MSKIFSRSGNFHDGDEPADEDRNLDFKEFRN